MLETARIVAETGFTSIRVDAEDVEALIADGIPASASIEPDVDPAILYGLPGQSTAPAMALVGTVMSTKRLQPGDAVSYGYLFRTPVETQVALVTGGYSQGVVRALGGKARAEIGGSLHPIVGRVAMDVCVVDLGDANVDEGAEVTYFGGTGAAQHELKTWTQATGLTAAELVCAAGVQSLREYIE